jgi:multiple sugar transport system permease protein
MYTVLVAVALIVLFPFVIAFTTSLKQGDDVFNYPPTVLPRAAATAVDGPLKGKPLYDLEVAGELRRVALEKDGASVLVLADPADPTTTFLVPSEDATSTGRTVVVAGEERSLVTALVEGETRTLARLRSGVGAVFTDPDDPELSVVRNVQDAVAVKELTAEPGNYQKVLELQRLDRSLTNTLLVTVLVVVGQVLTSILGGYAFSRMTFAGRDALFLGYIGSVMIPFVVLIIPLYQLMVMIGWVDSLVSLVVPFIFSAYGTFLMRQFFITIPKELEEAAYLDGASRWTVLWRIFVPLSVPAIATLSTFAFLYAWNSFVWPLVVINSGNLDNRVLALSLQVLGGRAADQPNLILAGVVIALLPPITVFVLAQRYFVENVASTGLKG